MSDAEFRRISALVYQHCRINLHEGKRELVRARIAKRMRAGGFGSVADYLDHVLADTSGNAFPELINTLCTNLTSFFRENAHFDNLSERYLPALLNRKQQQGDRRVVAWSAGCSSGEEPYSMAMILLDQVKGLGNWDIKILATDLSTKVLNVARKGVYREERIRSVPPQFARKYLAQCRTEEEDVFQVTREVRNVVRFRYLNLMQPWPFRGEFDFIFCRNVMIYFDKETQASLVNRYWDHLRPGGLLFTGHSESLTSISHRFRYVLPTIYCKPNSR